LQASGDHVNSASQPTPANYKDGGPVLLARPFIACLLLALVTLVVFWPVRTCEFLSLDDSTYITDNPYLRMGLSLKGVLWAFGTNYAAMWHPLTWLSYLLDADLFGLDPSGPHIINLLWHIGNALLLFLVLRDVTGAHWRSLFVAALFALHPLHTESVAWLSERKDVLSTFFALLALWAYCRYAGTRSGKSEDRSPKAERSPKSENRTQQLSSIQYPESSIPHPVSSMRNPASALPYLLCLGFFALGLMSKPMVVTLPFLLLLLDYWPLERFPDSRFQFPALWRLVREKVPFFLLSLCACVLTFWAARKGGAVQSLTDLSLGVRLENAFVAYARYLGKALWPTHLAVPYPHVSQWPLPVVAFAIVLMLGLSALALRFGRKLPFAVTGWFWFIGTLVPVIGLVQVGEHSLADRYTYVPLIGLFIVLAWGAEAAFARWRVPRLAGGIAAAVLIAACAARTRDQLRYWQSSQSVFTHSIAVTKDNWLAYFALGCDLSEKDRLPEAIQDYQRALQINPVSSETLNNLGNAYLRQDQTSKAVECLAAAVRLKPDRAEYRSNLGAALDKAGQTAEAINEYTEALRRSPDDALTHFRLGNTLAALGHTSEAIEHYRRALAERPDYTQALNNLGIALFKQGNLDEAVQQFRNVLRLDPSHASAYCNLANALAAQYKWPEAAEQYALAVRLMPDSIDAHYGLALVLERLGQHDQAVAEFQEVLRLKPTHAGAKQHLLELGAPK
jgi:tetratricopeptide (TPR) repeat protein